MVDCSGDHFKDPINDPWELYKLQFHRGELCDYARKGDMEREKEAVRGLSIVSSLISLVPYFPLVPFPYTNPSTLQFLHATKASQFPYQARKKVGELIRKNKQREKENQLLLGRIQVTQDKLKSAQNQLKERDATIIKLSQDLSAHDEDAGIIEKLKAELEGHAKDADDLKKCKAELAEAKKEKIEADESCFVRAEAV